MGYEDDDVDALIDAWSDILPDADLSPLDVMSRLRRAARRLDLVRTRAFRSAGLSTADFDVLSVLRRTEPPHTMRPADLAAATMVGTAGLTHRIDVLEARGLVTRDPHPDDRRGVLVRLEPEGARIVERAMLALVEEERAVLAPIDPAERAELVAALRILTRPDVR